MPIMNLSDLPPYLSLRALKIISKCKDDLHNRFPEPRVISFALSSFAQVTDQGVGVVSYYCRGLQQLNIQEVGGVTAAGYRMVRTNCRRCIIEHTNPAFSL